MGFFTSSGFEIGENMSSREVLISFPTVSPVLSPPVIRGIRRWRAEGVLSWNLGSCHQPVSDSSFYQEDSREGEGVTGGLGFKPACEQGGCAVDIGSQRQELILYTRVDYGQHRGDGQISE